MAVCRNCGSATCAGKCLDIREYFEFSELPRDVNMPYANRNFGFVVPKRTTNLFTNPTPVLNPGITGGLPGMLYGAVGTTLSIASNEGPRGPEAHRIDPTIGATGITARVTTVSNSPAGRTYRLCVDIRALCGRTLEIGFQTLGGWPYQPFQAFTEITATGEWQTACVCHTIETNAANDDFNFEQIQSFVISSGDNPPQEEWLTGGWVFEPGSPDGCCRPSTFISGTDGFDWVGLRDEDFVGDQGFYDWLGTPHQSRSTRGAYTQSGGDIVTLEECCFDVSGWSGFGMPIAANITNEYAKIDGANVANIKYVPTQATITGRFQGSPDEIMCNRECLKRALLGCSTKYREPILLRWQFHDDCGEPCGRILEAVVTYEGGLEGDLTSVAGEDVEIRLSLQYPFFKTMEKRSYRDVVAEANAVGGTQTFEIALCNRGSVAAAPIFLFLADQDSSFNVRSIENNDTGCRIDFIDGVGTNTVTAAAGIVVNTQPERPYIRRTNGDRIIGAAVPCSNLADFELACGLNHLTITVDDITDPSGYDPLTPQLTTIPPRVQFSFRETFGGVDGSCCEFDNCDELAVQAGFVYLD